MTATPAPTLIRQDGRDKVTGSGRYAADLTMTGMLHGALRVADLPHARIRRIDTTAARALPGVHRGHHGSATSPRSATARS